MSYWKRFNGFDMYCWCFVGRGTILDPRELREEGLHIIAPWDKLFLYDLRLQSTHADHQRHIKRRRERDRADQCAVSAAASLYRRAAQIHRSGIIWSRSSVPKSAAQAREVFSPYTAQQVYTSRDTIQQEILANTQKSLGANLDKLVQPEAMEQPDPKHYNDFLRGSIQILDTLVLSIELPPEIVAAINRQTEQYYLIQEYKFRVEREAEESKRKQIEANGIAAFQRTVSQGISDSYLRWRGIEATLALAQSRNAKIVVIGTGKDGLPIILGNVDSPAVPEPPPPGQPGANGPAAPSTSPSPAASDKASSGASPATPGATTERQWIDRRRCAVRIVERQWADSVRQDADRRFSSGFCSCPACRSRKPGHASEIGGPARFLGRRILPGQDLRRGALGTGAGPRPGSTVETIAVEGIAR